MSTSSNGEVSMQEEDPDQNLNKRANEKIRREQENLYLEELSQLVSGNILEFSDSDDSISRDTKLEKGSILKETVDRLRTIRNERGISQDATNDQLILPKQVLGSLVLEALDGFMFIVNTEGKVEFISENAQEYLGRSDTEILGESIYKFVYLSDHARLSVNLQDWEDGGKSGARQVDEETSKIFNVRFLIGKIKSEEPQLSHQKLYEDMQVSAMHMLAEKTDSENSNAVMCIARRIPANEALTESPVESFTTQIELDSWTVTAVDTSGLPKQYVEVIGPFCVGKKLTEIVHPQDVSLLKVHFQKLQREGSHVSRVYRLIFPPPHYTVHVKTKSRIFKPDTASSLKGFIMSTHNIVRENEVKNEQLPALTATSSSDFVKSELGSPSPVDPSMYGKIKIPIKEDVIMSSTKIEEKPEGDLGMDVESLLRGDPEVFTPMLRTAAKALSIPSQMLEAMMPRMQTSPGAASGNPSSQKEDESKQSIHERLNQAGINVIPASQVPRSNYTYSLTTIRSRNPSGRQGSKSPGTHLPSPGGHIPSPGRHLPSPGRHLPSPGGHLPSPGPHVPSPGTSQLSPSPPVNNNVFGQSNAQQQRAPPSSNQGGGGGNNTMYSSATSPRGSGAGNSIPSPLLGEGDAGKWGGGGRQSVSPGTAGSRQMSSSPTVVKNQRLSGLLSNALNVRSPSTASVTKSGPTLSISTSKSQPQPHTQQQQQQQLSTSKPNQLLKELLTAKENLSTRPASTENISLRQLLNGKQEKVRSDSELLRRLNEPTKDPRSRSKLSELTKLLESRAGMASRGAASSPKLSIPPTGSKRAATPVDQGPPAKQSSSSSTVPSLESLLRKDTASPVTTGISAKWSEIPNKNLSRSHSLNIKFNKSDTPPPEMGGGGPGGVSTGPGGVSSGPGDVSTATGGGGVASAKPGSNTSQNKQSTAANMDQSLSNQEFPSELFDLDLSELDSMMSPDLLSAVDNAIMSEDQAQISAIEQQLMQVEKSINTNQQQPTPLSQPTSSSPALTSTYSSPSSSLLSSKPLLSGGPMNVKPGGDMSPSVMDTGSAGPSQFQNAPKAASGNLAPSLLGNSKSSSYLSGMDDSQQQQQPRRVSQNIEDLMKTVPPNVTMKPGLDVPGGRKDSLPSRHLSGDALLSSGRLQSGGLGSPGVRYTNRHASGDSAYMSAADNPGVGSTNSIRRYSGDSILLRRLDPGSVSPRLGGRGKPGQGQSTSSTSGFSPGQSPRPGSGFGSMQSLSPDVNLPITIGSTNVGTVGSQRGQDTGSNKAIEVPSGRSLSQEDLESFGLSIEVTKEDYYVPGVLSKNNKQQSSKSSLKSGEGPSGQPPGQLLTSVTTTSMPLQQQPQQLTFQQQRLIGSGNIGVLQQQPSLPPSPLVATCNPAQQMTMTSPLRESTPPKLISPSVTQHRLTSPVRTPQSGNQQQQQGGGVIHPVSTNSPGGARLPVVSTGPKVEMMSPPLGNVSTQILRPGNNPSLQQNIQYQTSTTVGMVNSQQQGRVRQINSNNLRLQQLQQQQLQQQQQQQTLRHQAPNQQLKQQELRLLSPVSVPSSSNQRLVLTPGNLGPLTSGNLGGTLTSGNLIGPQPGGVGTVQLGSTSIQLTTSKSSSSLPSSSPQLNQNQSVSGQRGVGLVTISSSQSVTLQQNISQVSLHKTGGGSSGLVSSTNQLVMVSPAAGASSSHVMVSPTAGVSSSHNLVTFNSPATSQRQNFVSPLQPQPPQQQDVVATNNQVMMTRGVVSQENQILMKQLSKTPVPQSALNQQKSLMGMTMGPGGSSPLTSPMGPLATSKQVVVGSIPSPQSPAQGGGGGGVGSVTFSSSPTNFDGGQMRTSKFVRPGSPRVNFPASSGNVGLMRSPSVLQQALSNPPSILQSALSPPMQQQQQTVRQRDSRMTAQPGFPTGSMLRQQVRPQGGMRMVNPGAVMQATNQNPGAAGGGGGANIRLNQTSPAGMAVQRETGGVNSQRTGSLQPTTSPRSYMQQQQTNQATRTNVLQHQSMASSQGRVIMSSQGGAGATNLQQQPGLLSGGQVSGSGGQMPGNNQMQAGQIVLGNNQMSSSGRQMATGSQLPGGNQMQLVSQMSGGTSSSSVVMTSSVLQSQLVAPPSSRILDGDLWPSFKSDQDSMLLDSTLDELLQDS